MSRPVDEPARLAELRSYGILDTPPEPSFDRLTQLAARLCATPMAIVTLVDEGRQWFKSRVRIDASETDRAIAFCAHAIEHIGPFLVPDALADVRFATNPLVTAEPNIRFYHGIPLVNPRGFALGTLAVLDHVPRQLDELQADALEVLAEQVVVQLEQHRHQRLQEDIADELDRLNAELHHAASRYDELYRSNPMPMWISDVETLRILDVNDAAVGVYGWSRDELLAMTVDEIRPPEDVETFRRLLAGVADEQYYEMGPVRHRRADDTTFHVIVNAHRIDHGGRPARLVIARQLGDAELAERRVAEASERLAGRLTSIVDVWQRLSDGDETLDELYDSLPALAMDVLDAGGALLYLVDGDDVVPRSMAGYITVAPTLPIEGSLAGWVIREGRATRTAELSSDARATIRRAHPDGSRSLVLAPVHGSAGPIGVLVVQDRAADHFDDADERSLELLARALGAVVRRREAEAGRRVVEERLRIVVEATTDAIYDWNLGDGSVWWSQGIEDLFGWPAEMLMREPTLWAENLHPSDSDRVLEEVGGLIRDAARTRWAGTYRFRRADGTYAHVRDRASVIRGADGRVLRLVGGMSDVTEQVEAEARALQSQRLEAVGQLTGGVAHDFNNLLTVILGNADELVGDLDDRSDLREFAEMIRSAALRGAELSHRLLAFARRQALEPEAVDVNRLLAHLDGLLRRTLPEHVEIELVRAAGLWPSFVDAGQLEGALLNLCLNARDAMPAGGRLTIESANAHIDQQYADDYPDLAPGQYVMVAVSDTGSGIPAEIVDRVVEPFFTTKEHGVGTGLGLSMVHGFVKQSGGHIKIYSEVERGTTVRLYLPRASRAVTSPIEEPRVSPDLRGSERILLVEDDELVRTLASRHLAGLGYEVIPAASGPDALDELRRVGRVDLLFTDVVMPGGMGGRDLAAAALELQPDLLVLYTSGYTENAIVHHGRLDPGVHLLGKPYRPLELARKVRELLDDRDG